MGAKTEKQRKVKYFIRTADMATLKKLRADSSSSSSSSPSSSSSSSSSFSNFCQHSHSSKKSFQSPIDINDAREVGSHLSENMAAVVEIVYLSVSRYLE